MASEALDPNSPAYDPIFAERVRRARENPEPEFFGAFEPGGVFNPLGTGFAKNAAPAAAVAPAPPVATTINPGEPEHVLGGKDLPAAPAASAPEPPPMPRLVTSGEQTRIDQGPMSVYQIPGGKVSVDRSRGLSGKAWLDSVRNPDHSWNAATKGWVAPDSNEIIKSNQEPTSLDAMLAEAAEPEPQPKPSPLPFRQDPSESAGDEIVRFFAEKRGERAPLRGPVEPGSERNLFTVGRGDNAWIAGDVGARAEQQRQRGVDINELAAELAQAKGRAGIAEAEVLADDPFARERLQGQIGVERDVAPILARSYGSQKQEEARRAAFTAEQEKIVNSYIANKARLQAERNVAGLQELELRFAADYQRLLQRFGVGAGVREAFEPPDPFSVSAGG